MGTNSAPAVHVLAGHRWEGNCSQCGHTGSALASQGAPAATPSKLSTKISNRAVLSCSLWPGGVCSSKVGQLTAWLLIRLLIFTVSSFPSVSWGCTGAVSCLSCFTEGHFNMAINPKAGSKSSLCFSVEHEKQQGRAKHLWLLGKSWQVVRSQILCTLKLNISDGGKGQMEQDRAAVPMLYSTEI